MLSCKACMQYAECVGGVAAGLMAGPLYGTGATWLKKMLPWIRPTEDANGDDKRLESQQRASTRDLEAPLYAGKKDQPAKLGAADTGAAGHGTTVV